MTEKSWKKQILLNGADMENVDINVKCLCCDKVEVLGYFQFSGMRYGDPNAVTAILQPYSIWTTVHILEHVLAFQRGIWDFHNSWDGVLCDNS